MIALYPYCPPSFLTVLGSLAAVRRIKRRGFPESLRNWRFVTLTIDRSEYPDPSEGYDLAKRHLRKFIYALRKKYAIRRWCWKLEFHERDERTGEVYPHWHLLLDYKRPIPCEEITALWGKGRTEIKGVTDSRFDYLFKYVAKSVDLLPDWVLSRRQIRMFQTSSGFFPAGCVARELETASPRPAAVLPGSDTQNGVRHCGDGISSVFADREPRQNDTIGERLTRWARSVVSRSGDPEEGKPRYRLHIAIDGSWGELLVTACHHKFLHQLGESQIKITKNKIEASCLQFFPPSLLLYQQAYS